MKRNRTRGNWDDLGIFYPEGECGGRTIHEPEDADCEIPTGLLDARGRMIFRERPRIGFKVGK